MMRAKPTISSVVFGAVVIVALATFTVIELRRRAMAHTCQEHLEAIYGKLVAYDRDRGNLPVLSFFPDDAYTDPDSLYTVLAPYGLRVQDCTCPALKRHLQDLGVTYIWNDALNGRPLDSLTSGAWMLVEISALSRRVPPPHPGGYHILYADGHVERSPYPPPGI